MSRESGNSTWYAPWQVCFIWLLAGAATAFACASARGADDLMVKAEQAGHAVSVQAKAILTAPRDLIWSTLTDYDHLADFIPGISASRVIDRRGPTAIVEQRGEAAFFIFKYGIDVVVESVEYPPDHIEIRVVSGNLRQLEGAYQLGPGKKVGTWLLTWSGLIEPSLPLPSFIAVALMRNNVQAQFRGMINEIERRWAQMKTVDQGEMRRQEFLTSW